MIYSRPILETFLAVARHGNFSQAANVLHKSQSCVSMQIAQMERELGLTLLDRSARPLMLTDAGKRLLEFAKVIVRTIDECRIYMADMVAGTAGELKIGTSQSLGAFLVPPILGNVVKEFPKIKVQITVLGRPAVYDAIRQGEIHFGIVLADNPPPDLLATPFRREPLYFISSSNFSLARKRSVKIQDLLDSPFVLGTQGHDYTSMVDHALRRMGLKSYRIALRISNFEGMKKAIMAGIGIGILPRFVVDTELKQRILGRVMVKDANFSSSLILVESQKVLTLPAVEHIKKIFLTELQSA